jgi:amino acid transporter
LSKKVFVRDATGLVREFGTIEVLLIAMALIFGPGQTILEFPFFYGFAPGADLPTALIIATIPYVFLMLAYWMIGVAMPRSGNDYVWVGRILNAPVGFAWGVLYIVAVFFSGYVLDVIAFGSAISTSLTVTGTLYNVNSLLTAGNFLSGSPGLFITFTIVTILFALFGIMGGKWIKLLMYSSWIFAIIAIGIMWILLASVNPTVFAAKWNSTFPTFPTYQGLYTTAINAGFKVPVGGMTAILVALPLAALFPLGGNVVNGIAGEMKGVRKALPIALLLSLLFQLIFWVVSSSLTLNAVGSNWMSAIGYIWEVQSSAYPLSLAPSQPLLLSVIAYPNALLILIMFVTFIYGSIAFLFSFFWIPTRYIFAWSFDRILPTTFAKVNDRFNSPVNAITLLALIAILAAAGDLFTTAWGPSFAMITVVWEISYVIPSLALAVFPLIRKDFFEQAPEIVRKKIAGIPLVSVIGIITTIFYFLLGVVAATNPLIYTPTVGSIATTIGVIVAALFMYFVAVAYHKRHGIDIGLALKQIPPE